MQRSLVSWVWWGTMSPAFLRVRTAFPLLSLLLPVWHPLIQNTPLGSVHQLFPALEFWTGSLGKDNWMLETDTSRCGLSPSIGFTRGYNLAWAYRAVCPMEEPSTAFPDLGHWEEEEEHDQCRPPSRISLYVTETLA